MRLLNKRQLMLVMDVRGGIFEMRLSNDLESRFLTKKTKRVSYCQITCDEHFFQYILSWKTNDDAEASKPQQIKGQWIKFKLPGKLLYLYVVFVDSAE